MLQARRMSPYSPKLYNFEAEIDAAYHPFPKMMRGSGLRWPTSAMRIFKSGFEKQDLLAA